MSRLIALYPRSWRDRYEVEFRALVADRPTDPLDGVDIVRGISGQPGCAAPHARGVTHVATPT